MDENPLPSNDDLLAYSQALDWETIEDQKRKFNKAVKTLAADPTLANTLPLETLADAVGAPITTYFDPHNLDGPNVLLVENNGHSFVLGSYVEKRYRKGKSIMDAITPYNLNPSVNHTNLHETNTPTTRMRALGAEIELGLLHPDGNGPEEDDVKAFIRAYQGHARHFGVTPQVDREACQYQIETHVAPGIGYNKTRHSIEGIMKSLMASSEDTGLRTAIMSVYPVESDFKVTDDPKVATAVDLMAQINNKYEIYGERLAEAKAMYHIDGDIEHIHKIRIQGCHIHLEIAGRSEALGLLTYYTMLRSATAIANAAVLKGGPFINGTCDPQRLCAREHLRRTTITGNYIEIPVSPHISENGLNRYSGLLNSGHVNAVARAMLIDESMPEPISAMHNGIGRVRPDLGSSKRICTVESTGMPANVSAARMAAVLTDFEFSHTLMELYFRQNGCDLAPMFDNQVFWEVMGPLSPETFRAMHDHSDRAGSEMTLTTAAGTQMSLGEFYDKKRIFMHKALADVEEVMPRDIDDVYTSLTRMLTPPSGKVAETVEQYVLEPKLRSTGNWGQILRNTYQEEGGVIGDHCPDAVLRVTNRLHQALHARYLGT